MNENFLASLATELLRHSVLKDISLKVELIYIVEILPPVPGKSVMVVKPGQEVDHLHEYIDVKAVCNKIHLNL